MKKHFLALALVAALSTTTAFAGQLTIIKADYAGGDVHRDVTALLATKVQGGRLVLRVGNNTLGGVDPCFGKVKNLTVQYRNENGLFTVTAREGDNLELPSPQAILISPLAEIPTNPAMPSATVVPATVSENASSNHVLTPAAQAPVPQITLPLAGQEFTILDGDKYTNVTVRKIEPDGLVVADSDGVRKLKFKNLPSDVGTKYGYDSARASQYQAVLIASAIAAQKQAEQINAAAASVQAAKAAEQQQASVKEQRFAAWTQELARQREVAANTQRADLFRFDNPEKERANQRANAFEARIIALHKQIDLLDHAGVSSETTQTIIDAVYEKRIFIGMPATCVLLSWGQPDHVNSTTLGSGSHDQWVYGSSYVYIENGVVTSMQN